MLSQKWWGWVNVENYLYWALFLHITISSSTPSRILEEEKQLLLRCCFSSAKRGRYLKENFKEQLRPWQHRCLSYVTDCERKKGEGLAHLSFLYSLFFPKTQGQGMVETRPFVLEGTYIKCYDLLGVVIAACYPSGTVKCNVQIHFSVMEECRMWPFIFKFEEIIKANLLWFSPCSNYNTEHFKCSYCQIYLHIQCKLK